MERLLITLIIAVLFLILLFVLSIFVPKLWADSFVLRPAGDCYTASGQWDANTGTRWQAIDEVDADGDTTYIRSETKDDQYGWYPEECPPGVIDSLKMVWVMKDTTGASGSVYIGRMFIVEGVFWDCGSGFNEWYTEIPLTGSYAEYSYTWALDPCTGEPWNPDSLNSHNNGFGIWMGPAGGINLATQSYIEVFYTPIEWGEPQGAVIYPDANCWGEHSGRSGCSVNSEWDCVNEITADEDASYVIMTGYPTRETFYCTDVSLTAIDSIRIYARARKSSGLAVLNAWDVGYSWSDGEFNHWVNADSNKILTTSYTTGSGMKTVDENGNPWTSATINNHCFGARLHTNLGSGKAMYLTWVQVSVYGTSAGGKSKLSVIRQHRK